MDRKDWDIRVEMKPSGIVMVATLGKHNLHYYDHIKDTYSYQKDRAIKIVLTGRSNETFLNLNDFEIFLEEHELIENTCVSCCIM